MNTLRKSSPWQATIRLAQQEQQQRAQEREQRAAEAEAQLKAARDAENAAHLKKVLAFLGIEAEPTSETVELHAEYRVKLLTYEEWPGLPNHTSKQQPGFFARLLVDQRHWLLPEEVEELADYHGKFGQVVDLRYFEGNATAPLLADFADALDTASETYQAFTAYCEEQEKRRAANELREIERKRKQAEQDALEQRIRKAVAERFGASHEEFEHLITILANEIERRKQHNNSEY